MPPPSNWCFKHIVILLWPWTSTFWPSPPKKKICSVHRCPKMHRIDAVRLGWKSVLYNLHDIVLTVLDEQARNIMPHYVEQKNKTADNWRRRQKTEIRSDAASFIGNHQRPANCYKSIGPINHWPAKFIIAERKLLLWKKCLYLYTNAVLRAISLLCTWTVCWRRVSACTTSRCWMADIFHPGRIVILFYSLTSFILMSS